MKKRRFGLCKRCKRKAMLGNIGKSKGRCQSCAASLSMKESKRERWKYYRDRDLKSRGILNE